MQKLLGITDQAVQDSVPSLVLQRIQHTGPGAQSFHAILYSKIPAGTRAGQFTNAQIIQLLEETYTEFGRPDVWPAAAEWLRLRGIH